MPLKSWGGMCDLMAALQGSTWSTGCACPSGIEATLQLQLHPAFHSKMRGSGCVSEVSRYDLMADVSCSTGSSKVLVESVNTETGSMLSLRPSTWMLLHTCARPIW